MILFTADWHIKLGQKNVPIEWAKNRYYEFFKQVHEIEKQCDLHIIGGDVFDRVPSLAELELFFDFITEIKIPTIIYDGNHEATKKNKTFFSHLKLVVNTLNPQVNIIDESVVNYSGLKFSILPYADLHKKGSIEQFNTAHVLFTHVRGEIPPHVKPEVDLDRFDKFPIVFAGDLHAHNNTQRNIVYPGSPMTTSFHRKEVKTGYILIDQTKDFAWSWHEFELPQLIRKTVQSAEEMVPTSYHHTIYELEGNIQDLSEIKNSDLLDKKVIKRNTEATLIIDKDMTLEQELTEYLAYILELDEPTINNILKTFHDYAKTIRMG